MSSVIVAEHLEKSYGASRALNDFSLIVPRGVIFGLLGPNGAGKTTAIEIMLGLRSPDAGTVVVLDADPSHNFHSISPRIGAMLQEGGMNPGLTAQELLVLYSSFYERPLKVKDLLERCDLSHVKAPVRRLSGGQKQSLSLALAIVGQPELVFLDEPTVGMDPHARRRTWEIIKELKEAGSTVVLTTHLMDEAEMLCDEIAIVSRGKVIEQGQPHALTSSHQDTLEIEFDHAIDAYSLGAQLKVDALQHSDTTVRVTMQPSSDFLVTLAKYAQEQKNPIIRYASQQKNLEDVFLELTSSDGEMQ